VQLLNDKIIAHVWTRMTAIYGHKWVSPMGIAVDGMGILTDAAKTWQKGLSGVSVDGIRTAFSTLVTKNYDWPPSLPEFRKLCLGKGDAPVLDEVVSMLVMVSSKQGSIAERYKHPLVFSIASRIDMHSLRTAKTIEARRMVKPVFEDLISSGWEDWPAHAFDNQKAISAIAKPASAEKAKAHLMAMRAAL
jgi:hypothetical protein